MGVERCVTCEGGEGKFGLKWGGWRRRMGDELPFFFGQKDMSWFGQWRKEGANGSEWGNFSNFINLYLQLCVPSNFLSFSGLLPLL